MFASIFRAGLKFWQLAGTAGLIAILYAIGSVSDSHAIGPWTNGQAATLVLGQVDFTSTDTDTTANRLSDPIDVAIDPLTGKVFVLDYYNRRILRFAAGSSLVNGASAEAVLGQPDFTSASSGTTASTLKSPMGIFFDAGGRLWVADSGNNRVLRFDNAASKVNGASADGVLGQADFTSGESATAQNRMYSPRSVFVDPDGRLWVADQSNCRVLRFDQAATKLNGANADGVLGQPDFNSKTWLTTRSGMSSPHGVTVTPSGTLFVAEHWNNRVTRFDNAATKTNGANADGVLGQPNFTSRTVVVSPSGMNMPIGVTVDNEGRLYVADNDSNRVLIFNNATTLANGANADYVLGQSNFTAFTANTGGISASTLQTPHHLFVDHAASVLWVADKGNDRVLRYQTPKALSKTYLPLLQKQSAPAASQNHSAITLADNRSTFERISRNLQGTPPNYGSITPSISGDGRYVAFLSAATDLVAVDSNDKVDVFVYDRQSGQTKLASLSSAGVQADRNSSAPFLSANGRYVAFQSTATNLVPGDNLGYTDIFVYDLQTHQIERVSITSSGEGANDHSSNPSLSADGRYVVFESTAPNLKPAGISLLQSAIILHDRQTGITTCISTPTTIPGAHSFITPIIAADGNTIVYIGHFSECTPSCYYSIPHVFIYNRLTQETYYLEKAATQGYDGMFTPGVSVDGRYIGLLSYLQFDPNDVNLKQDVYLYDQVTKTYELISVASDGTQSDGNASQRPFISSDGRWVGFRSLASTLVPNDLGLDEDVFIRDRQTGQTMRVTERYNSVTGVDENRHGSFAMTADAKHVAFSSLAAMSLEETNGYENIFLWGRSYPVFVPLARK